MFEEKNQVVEQNIKSVEDFLRENGIESDNLATKEKLEALKKIVFRAKVDKDWEELQYHKETNQLTVDEFLEVIQECDLRICTARRYMSDIYRDQKEENKQKRQQTVQKIKSLFIKR